MTTANGLDSRRHLREEEEGEEKRVVENERGQRAKIEDGQKRTARTVLGEPNLARNVDGDHSRICSESHTAQREQTNGAVLSCRARAKERKRAFEGACIADLGGVGVHDIDPHLLDPPMFYLGSEAKQTKW